MVCVCLADEILRISGGGDDVEAGLTESVDHALAEQLLIRADDNSNRRLPGHRTNLRPYSSDRQVGRPLWSEPRGRPWCRPPKP